MTIYDVNLFNIREVRMNQIDNMEINRKKRVRMNIMSDLHMEFGSPSPEYYSDNLDKYDIFIIAGDISNNNSPEKLRELADLIAPKKLVYVTGNHDYYRSSRKIIDAELEKLNSKIDNFIFLNHKVINIMGVNFVGCTGWQNYKDYNSYDFHINDFNMISDHEENIHKWGEEDYNFLHRSLIKLHKKPVVVITHVPPSPFVLDLTEESFREEPLFIHAYSNNYDELIKVYNPILWICGHAHDSFNKVLHKTRIVRNSYGYHGMKHRNNPDFTKSKIVNINLLK